MGNSVLSDKSRLAIMTALAAAGEEMSFGDLMEETELTNGNLSSHLKKLKELDLIDVKKQFANNRPLTTVAMTAAGKRELKSYIVHIKAILEKVSKLT